MDFTIKTYRKLLQTLQSQGFSFLTFKEYLEHFEAMRAGSPPRLNGGQALEPVPSYREGRGVSAGFPRLNGGQTLEPVSSNQEDLVGSRVGSSPRLNGGQTLEPGPIHREDRGVRDG